MGDSDFGDGNRPKKYHEGWVQHQAGDGKGWKDLWMVLRGEYLYIFKNDRTTNDSLIGTLHLGTDTQCKTLPGSKKSYKIQVFTIGKFGEEKVNLFKFQKENDRDVWKSFIVGISVGIVPSDVHLLPGQLKDVHMAIDEVRNLPPPLPATIPRPKVAPVTTGLFSRPQEVDRGYNSRPPEPDRGYNFAKYNNNNTKSYNNNYDDDDVNDDGDSNHSGSFRSHLTRKTLVSSPTPTDATMMSSRYDGGGGGGRGGTSGGGTGGEVLNLRQLRNRQQDLVTKSLVGPSPDAPTSPRNRTQERTPPATGRDYGNDETVSNDSGYSPNHNQTHLFYTSPELNRDTPQWFFDNMPREDAESILTCGRKFGNVLMRPSSTFHSTQKYVISMRREVAGGTNLNHYEVVRKRDGFKINVDNDHAAMRSLSEVMDFFVNVAGPGTKPMRTNDLSKIYSNTMSMNSANNPTSPGPQPHSPIGGPSSAFHPPPSRQTSVPPPPPGPPPPPMPSAGYNGSEGQHSNGFSTMDRMAENSFDVPTPTSPPPQSNWSFKPDPQFNRQDSGPSWAPPSTNDRRQQQLNVTGNVDSGIAMAVSEMNENLSRAQADGGEEDWRFEYQNVNANGKPPPAQTSNWRDPAPDYGRHNSYGMDRYDGGRGAGPPPNGGYGAPSLNQTVPARQAPSSGGIYGRREPTYGGQGEFNGSVPPPPSFMPPPVPPPPPAGGGIPPPPPINSQGFRTLGNPSNGPPPPPQQQQGFNTAPNRGNNAGGGGGGGGMGFEDELKGRLKGQREQIYATGATVLRSNWN